MLRLRRGGAAMVLRMRKRRKRTDISSPISWDSCRNTEKAKGKYATIVIVVTVNKH